MFVFVAEVVFDLRFTPTDLSPVVLECVEAFVFVPFRAPFFGDGSKSLSFSPSSPRRSSKLSYASSSSLILSLSSSDNSASESGSAYVTGFDRRREEVSFF